MRRAFFFVTMALAVLLCSMDTPVLAHALDGPAAHANVAADLHLDASDSDDDRGDRSNPSHAIHHHCHGEVGIRLSNLEALPRAKDPAPYPQAFSALASHADAPLTEPPAA